MTHHLTHIGVEIANSETSLLLTGYGDQFSWSWSEDVEQLADLHSPHDILETFLSITDFPDVFSGDFYPENLWSAADNESPQKGSSTPNSSQREFSPGSSTGAARHPSFNTLLPASPPSSEKVAGPGHKRRIGSLKDLALGAKEGISLPTNFMAEKNPEGASSPGLIKENSETSSAQQIEANTLSGSNTSPILSEQITSSQSQAIIPATKNIESHTFQEDLWASEDTSSFPMSDRHESKEGKGFSPMHNPLTQPASQTKIKKTDSLSSRYSGPNEIPHPSVIAPGELTFEASDELIQMAQKQPSHLFNESGNEARHEQVRRIYPAEKTSEMKNSERSIETGNLPVSDLKEATFSDTDIEKTNSAFRQEEWLDVLTQHLNEEYRRFYGPF
ncbi:MAG: hypothetical protein AAF388_00030 [Bacteroidota bacterium]